MKRVALFLVLCLLLSPLRVQAVELDIAGKSTVCKEEATLSYSKEVIEELIVAGY